MQIDPFQHFLDAQNPIYDQVLQELRNGRKVGHWIWWIFPQLKGWVLAQYLFVMP